MKTRKNFRFHYFFLIILFASLLISVGSATWVLFGHNDIGSPVYDSGNLLAEYFDESYSVVYNGETQSTIPSFKEGNPGDKQLTDFNYKFTKYHTKTTATPKDANKYTVAITPKDNPNTQPLYVTLTIEKRKVKLNNNTVEIDYTGTHPTVSTILNNQFVDAETYSDGKNGVCVPEYTTDYSISNLTNGVEQPKTNTIDVGSTYIGQVSNKNVNFEFSNQEIVLKYKTVELGGVYYTIEDALNTASSGETITIKADTSFASIEVSKNEKVNYSADYYNIKHGVTLFLPFETNNTSVNTTNQGTSSSYGKSKNVELIIAPGLTINNYGDINIGGVTSGQQNYAGGTTGKYGLITMKPNSTIYSEGNINAYGFIVGDNDDTSAQVIMAAGRLIVPFIVVEHRGGSQFLEMIGGIFHVANPNLQTSPFNTFYTENVRTKITIESGAAVQGHANLYAGSQDNTTDINLIGGSATTSLINLTTADSKIVVEYEAGVTKLEIIGNAAINHLSLKVSVSGLSATLSTESVHFPISYRYNVTISPYENGNSSTVDATAQKLKILPDGKVTINPNATLVVSELTVYDKNSFTNVDDSSIMPYLRRETDAYLIVNGKLIGNKIAGTVQTSKDRAELSVTVENTITTKELQKKPDGYKEITQTLNGNIFGGTAGTMSAGKYVSKDQSWISEGRTATITYNFVYRDDAGSLQPFTGQVSNPNPATYSAFEDVILMEASSDGWLFDSWYSDINCSTKIDMFNGLDKANGITLYGLFEKVAQDQIYTISFDTKYNDKTTDSGITIENVQKLVTQLQDGGDFDIYNDVAIQQSITSRDYDITAPYYFEQWYLDENRTIPYTNEKAIEMYPQGGETIVLYAGWSQKNTLTVNVTAKGNNGSILGKGDSVTISISISADKSTTNITGDVTGAGGDSGLFKDHEGKASSQTFVAYLLKDQSYSVSFSSSGQVKSGEASGTMGTENITVTIDNL